MDRRFPGRSAPFGGPSFYDARALSFPKCSGIRTLASLRDAQNPKFLDSFQPQKLKNSLPKNNHKTLNLSNFDSRNSFIESLEFDSELSHESSPGIGSHG